MSIIIETERLQLRTWTENDIEPFYTMNQHPEVIRYLKGAISYAEARAFYQRVKKQYEEREYTLYAVSEKGGESFIGFVGLNGTTFLEGIPYTVEIGWRLNRPFWGKGYATEAAKAVRDHAFTTLLLPEIVSFTTIHNTASINVMKKIGLHRNPDDDFDHPYLSNDNPLKPHVLYRLTREQ